ncbi:hypothetical protein MAR_017245 [Mya arenaria]|uniref:DZANK-type domain-containing protein n=1 Tax=Mya arenaria TaxID=6604 RepID=A0ABY7EEQ9_MYAAR|nr:hypothetical protein MAR_017245 [Mya arenaria]
MDSENCGIQSCYRRKAAFRLGTGKKADFILGIGERRYTGWAGYRSQAAFRLVSGDMRHPGWVPDKGGIQAWYRSKALFRLSTGERRYLGCVPVSGSIQAGYRSKAVFRLSTKNRNIIEQEGCNRNIMKKCSNRWCGFAAESTFCPECGFEMIDTPTNPVPRYIVIICDGFDIKGSPCGAELKIHQKFCRYCGKEVDTTMFGVQRPNFEKCMGCGNELTTGAKHCHECGLYTQPKARQVAC